MTERKKVSLLTGATPGIACIPGTLLRTGVGSRAGSLYALWRNRLLTGMAGGLLKERAETARLVLRSALTGPGISFAFFSADGFRDAVSLRPESSAVSLSSWLRAGTGLAAEALSG